MTTLRQAVERSREHAGWPRDGTLGVSSLVKHFHPDRPASARSLLDAMNRSAALRMPWAVILCRFKGAAGKPAVENPVKGFFERAFTPGTGGLVNYWRDASLGAIDITGSRVFDWVEIAIPRSKAGGHPGTTPAGPGRAGLITAARDAIEQRHPGVLKSFHSSIAVYTENWSKDDHPPAEDRASEPYWIDGSASGIQVCLTPPFDGTITAHEMGHGFGMNHDVAPDLVTEYKDPSCIMSQNGVFTHPTFQVHFGPALCVPHLIQRNWMYKSRVHYDEGAWLDRPQGITLLLAPITRPGAQANLAAKLAYRKGNDRWDYYLEYVVPTEWNQGVPGAPFVFVRRIVAVTGLGETPAYLGPLQVPMRHGASAEFTEPVGKVHFRAELIDQTGPIVRVTARRA
jgi:hypothetical protein